MTVANIKELTDNLINEVNNGSKKEKTASVVEEKKVVPTFKSELATTLRKHASELKNFRSDFTYEDVFNYINRFEDEK